MSDICNYEAEYPKGLKTAEEVAATLKGTFTVERLLELAEAGYMPCFKFEGGKIRFQTEQVKSWIARNMMTEERGIDIDERIRVVIPAPCIIDPPPDAIANVPGLRQIPREPVQPGVYFLCDGDRVIYVGQSTRPMTRLENHYWEGKRSFDRIYLLPVPESELNNVEAAFIKHLQPETQGGIRSGKKPAHPGHVLPIHEILARFGFTLEADYDVS